MGKAKTPKRASTSSGPYDRKQSKPSANTNIFKFDKDFGQHILKNPGIRLALCSEINQPVLLLTMTNLPVMRLSRRRTSNPPMLSSKSAPERATVCASSTSSFSDIH